MRLTASTLQKILAVIAVATALLVAVIARESARSNRGLLPTGKAISFPAPGFIAHTNSHPANIAVRPVGAYAALLNQGYGTEESRVRQSIAILDLTNNDLRDFPDDRLLGDDKNTSLSYFVGLAFSTDGRHLYASMGSATENGIAIYQFEDGEIEPEAFITIPAQRVARGKSVTLDLSDNRSGTLPAYPAGFAVLSSAYGDRLLVANNLSDTVVLLDALSGQVLESFDVSTSKYIPAAYPYTVVANRAATKAWVSLWNASTIAELDLKKGKVRRRIELWRPSDPVAPGTHPTAMLLNKAEDKLYVALANAGVADGDGVAEVNLKRGVPERCYRPWPESTNEPGASSLAVALSPDEKYLYVAAASLNAVAVFPVSGNQSSVVAPIGFVPTEWYPSALAIAGNDLLIASAKGASSGPNNMRAAVQTSLHPSPNPYIATLIGGALQRLGLAEINSNLSAYSRQVEDNNFVHVEPGQLNLPGGHNTIRHVIYILKENRTYDQIFGDLGVGDRDPSLAIYGNEVTPNEHKLALQFGVLDNFYDSGDVSANGHLWSDASATSDYIEKVWPIIYRSSKRPQDQRNPFDEGIPMPDDPGTGFLWDNLAKHNFTYRIYGEMLQAAWCRDEKVTSPREGAPSPISDACPSAEIKPGESLPPSISNPAGAPSPWPWPIPRLKSIRPTKEAQKDHIDPLYADFAIDYPDQFRADEFLREFREFVNARGTSKELPQFVQLWLPNDHTGGTRIGKPAPRASVADNDLAVGRVVDAVSHSPYWDDTAIFVVEDDAQDGADHVDAHRSTALVISKYSPHSPTPVIDHHFYTTVSMIRTMEELLRLPPMNLFDARAPVMAPLFAGDGSQPPYEADDRNLRSGLLYEMNGKNAPGSKQSAAMDFSRPDAVNAQELNAILWQDAKSRKPILAVPK